MDKEYIGDGVYVWWDGFSLHLTTERNDGTHFIYIEPQMLNALNNYFKRATSAPSNG